MFLHKFVVLNLNDIYHVGGIVYVSLIICIIHNMFFH